MLTKNQILDVIKKVLAAYKTSILDKQYATIQYVDDTVSANRIDMCTDEEIDSMLASKLVVSEDNDDLVFLEELPPEVPM